MIQLWSRRFTLAAGMIWLLGSAGTAQERILSAPDAAKLVASGEIVLLDIRSRAEWKDSGLANGALPISMHEQGFGQKLQALMQEHGPERIALICATGGRSDHVIGILEQNGISGVWDVSEGMMGNNRGPGWIARQMPIVNLETAETNLHNFGVKTSE